MTLFGTDGIRGAANHYPMTPEVALAVGRAGGTLLRGGGRDRRVVIGKDTRLSGYMLEPALTAGFIASGVDVMLLGPIPTPAVAFLTRSMRADLGVMITASHNSYTDNGIKLFGSDGYKLPDVFEETIERLVNENTWQEGGTTGVARRYEDARGRYLERIKSTIPRDLSLKGMKVVVDCAHGAAYEIAPRLLFELGGDVIAIGVDPDGVNINAGCGATDTALLARTVREKGADMGIALDGDADRLILVDETGTVIDGDRIIAAIVDDTYRRPCLNSPIIVGTVMTNLGLERFLTGLNLELLRTAVGDRFVVEAMRTNGAYIGGEPSGHIVIAQHGTTGDGLVAALQIAAIAVSNGRRVSEVCDCFEPLPQLHRTLPLADRRCLEQSDRTSSVQRLVTDAERELAGQGRLVVRPSGTEPLLRMMVEADDPEVASAVLDRMTEQFSDLLNAA
ncbi:MAG: phosphoglucosamine mutase [Geminicoccaceae bacterium]